MNMEFHWTKTSNLGKPLSLFHLACWVVLKLEFVDRNSLCLEFTIFDLSLKGFLDNRVFKKSFWIAGRSQR